ncbi:MULTISPECIES: DUF4190 domain-containing protein [unclassified Rathayibacter]|uniref:DUF4190 domain-containing protein n=1 Tax=unclassified Rathayibacter TaxID=2609250 RepID=UPI00188B6A5B|nr:MULTISPECIES: DUF4190 domain-containing protein [unclassified Rathayibacter]MBF4463530.1 DUF4190 domain-containing protein [Rathayibacter sp. VKM Ac-2879]MBF4505020.1 DUF4190 domain-containing protein [Rathayibacter sp. VKM Ac-2878]
MFAGLQGWHLLLILVVFSPVIVLAIGLPIALAQGRARRDAGLVTDPRVNTVAVVAFVLSFFAGIGGVVCGHVARAQIRRTGEAGWGLALFALILGYYATTVGLLVGGAVLASALARA